MTAPADTPVDPALARAALEVAIRAARKDEAFKAYQAVRAAAEALFAQARNRGVPQVELRLPDGTKLGLISIRKGAEIWTVDEDTLTAVAAGNDPADFEDVIDPKALRDREVIDLIAEHFPELVTARIMPVARARYQREWEENGGKITDQSVGERVRVAEVEHMPATGEFAYRPASKAGTLIEEAIGAGLINEWGEVPEPARALSDQNRPRKRKTQAERDEAAAAKLTLLLESLNLGELEGAVLEWLGGKPWTGSARQARTATGVLADFIETAGDDYGKARAAILGRYDELHPGKEGEPS